MTNHWGYNTLGFFAPHPAYASAADPQGVVDEVKGMVKLLHREGIEVLLDVVYNHTAEQDRTGATLSWRGLDQRAYYRLDERGRDIDVTGCGNTLDLRHPVVCRMVLDSLRYWVREYHVDGFRFDLAVALGRGRGDDFDPDHPFLVALRTDPVLSGRQARGRALGRRDARLAHRPVPPTVHGVERPLPRRGAALLGRRRARPAARPARPRPRGARDPAGRVARPVRAPRPRPDRLGELRRGPRRVHRRRPRRLRLQAQRGERRAEPRRQPGQRLVEPRRRGPDRRRRGAAPPGGWPCATCSARCCSRPGCRCSTPATRSAAPRAATTTPTARTTRRPGCTGTSSPGSRTCSRRRAT